LVKDSHVADFRVRRTRRVQTAVVVIVLIEAELERVSRLWKGSRSRKPLAVHPRTELCFMLNGDVALRWSKKAANHQGEKRSGSVQLYISAFQSDCHCVRSVICAEFEENVLNVSFHGGLSKRQLSGDDLV
jgi:hypothetical protein